MSAFLTTIDLVAESTDSIVILPESSYNPNTSEDMSDVLSVLYSNILLFDSPTKASPFKP